jgi:sialidase-1
MPARPTCLALATLLLIAAIRLAAAEGPTKDVLLPPGPKNPRNSEGDFIQLRDGRMLFVYTHFLGGGGDHSAAHLAGRYSSDAGLTWTKEDATIVANEGGWNVMSVSLLRLADGRIALFYLRKNSLNDCRPWLRISDDEAETWSEPKLCIDDEVGYYVLNNDRAVQLESGRLILPVALHNKAGYEKPDWDGKILCYFSDDLGGAWRRSKSLLVGTTPEGKRATLQEPGLIVLRGGRLMMFCRTRSGSQYLSFSKDDGDMWSEFAPSNIISPCSPASIERIPKTGDLLLVWNNHQDVDDAHRGKRTPYNVALSRDEGKTWEKTKTLEDDANGWYCYTAMYFVGDHVLLGHCAGDRRTGGLNTTQITRFTLDWLYDRADDGG